MRLLVVGGGGREHAIVWKLSQNADDIFAIPGNPGISRLARCAYMDVKDVEGIASFAEDNEVDLTIVGPELPLVAGIQDAFERRGLKLFGPSQAAAMLEGSKSFAKKFMDKFDIPTAEFAIFDDSGEAERYIRTKGVPIVIKADGLAAGKGVVVAFSVDEAVRAVRDMMINRVFGDAGRRIVVEDYLEGEEASYLVVSDGEKFVPLATSQDHKRVFDGDRGPNTGGMGAYSPAPVLSSELEVVVRERIIAPTVDGMRRMGTPFKGVLYAGLMITDEGPFVLEFNVRFGDPEAQVILRRMETSLVDLCVSVVDGKLKDGVSWLDKAAVCVVLASEGYPGRYSRGMVISGIDEAERVDDVLVFHAGTSLVDGRLVTNGGRVLNVTAVGDDISDARHNAYEAVGKIHFDGMHYRKDIGLKALMR